MKYVAGLHQSSPAELKEQLEAERAGQPFLLYREPEAGQAIVPLTTGSLTVGRGEGCDVCLAWDGDVSRVHAELERKGGVWTVSDDGLSRNGTYVNGERVSGRRRLRDGDCVRFGGTVIRFREPSPGDTGETRLVGDAPPEARVSEAQKRVLVALCRPFADGSPYATPATNQEIADRLFLSVDAVKTHMRALFDKFDVGDVPKTRSERSSSNAPSSRVRSARRTSRRFGACALPQRRERSHGKGAALRSARPGRQQQSVKLSFGHGSGDLHSTERVGRPRGREAAAILGEDDLEALQQPGQEFAWNALIVCAGLAVVAVRGREGERSIAAHTEGSCSSPM